MKANAGYNSPRIIAINTNKPNIDLKRIVSEFNSKYNPQPSVFVDKILDSKAVSNPNNFIGDTELFAISDKGSYSIRFTMDKTLNTNDVIVINILNAGKADTVINVRSVSLDGINTFDNLKYDVPLTGEFQIIEYTVQANDISIEIIGANTVAGENYEPIQLYKAYLKP